MFSRKIANRLGGQAFVEFYQEPVKQAFHFCYINCNKNYMINCVEQLFLGKQATMFLNNERFVIHKINKYCTALQNTTTPPEPEQDIHAFITTTFPKHKFLPLVVTQLNQHQLVNKSTMVFQPFPNIHIADFCSFINNTFGKLEKTESKFIKLCKYLQSKGLLFPKISIKNPVAQKYLCS